MSSEWSPEEEALLEKAVMRGSTRSEVAELLAKQEREIDYKARELGLVDGPPVAAPLTK